MACNFLPQEPEAVEAAATPISSAIRVTGLEAFTAAVPDATVRDLDLETALTLVAMPLSCVDRPQATPRDRSGYLDDVQTTRRPGYERDRAFYGCWDWHSAVNSTWAMVRINKEFPGLPIAGLVHEKLDEHLSQRAMAGEMKFFEDNRSFERTYGWAWLLELYAELRTWDDPRASDWADNVEPLATVFSDRMVGYLSGLDRPSRTGVHSNTAFSLAMMLDAARTVDDADLEEAITGASRRLFLGDFSCPTAYEPWAADFLSPCLEEAALMAAVLPQDEFVRWFGGFMPAPDSRAFRPLTMPVYSVEDVAEGDGSPVDDGASMVASEEGPGGDDGDTGDGAGSNGRNAGIPEENAGQGGDGRSDERGRAAGEALQSLASRSHLIGLAFIRADAMNRIAAALPAGDARIEAYHKLAAYHGAMGFDAMFDAAYAGTHWIGTFALKYLLSAR